MNSSRLGSLREEPPVFFNRSDTLTFKEADYYQDLFYRTVKIGTELEFALPKGVKHSDLIPLLAKILKPSNDMNNLGELGVFDISKEHCGVEIRIIGRHPHWQALVQQYQQILAPLWNHNVRMRPTCGLHFHLIGIGLSESVPDIVIANLWNIARRYGPGLKFLTSAGDSHDGLCRRRQHNAHLEFLRLSPEKLSCLQIQQKLKESFDVPEHQNFLNLEHLRFDEQGRITTFHVELRFPDGDLSAVSISAKTFLFFAMLLKAVEISKFGLLHVGKTNQWQRKKELLDLISNNDGKLATSDTSGCKKVLGEYRENANGLLRFLKSIFILLDNPAELILQELAQCPVSLKRNMGKSWQEIDQDLTSLLVPKEEMDNLDYEIAKIIELGLVEGETGLDSWFVAASIRINYSPEVVKKRLEKQDDRDPRWDSELRRVVFFK